MLHKFRSKSQLVVGLIFFTCMSVSSKGMAEINELGYKSDHLMLNGHKFHYLEKGEGAPILFLHGFPFNSETWYSQMQPLSDRHQVVALDGRGYPRSAKPESIENYSIDRLVSDVSKFIKNKFGDEKVVLVGHDWGGTLAWTVAQKHPELLDKLVVINAPPYNVFLKMLATNQSQQTAASYIPRLVSDEFEQMLIKNGPASVWGFGFNKLYDDGHIDDEFKERYFAAWNEDGAIRGGINWYRANIPAFDQIAEKDYWPSKGSRVVVPTLLLWADGEAAFVTDTFKAIPNYVDDLTVKMIENSGHMVQLERPEVVNKHIQQFLEAE